MKLPMRGLFFPSFILTVAILPSGFAADSSDPYATLRSQAKALETGTRGGTSPFLPSSGKTNAVQDRVTRPRISITTSASDRNIIQDAWNSSSSSKGDDRAVTRPWETQAGEVAKQARALLYLKDLEKKQLEKITPVAENDLPKRIALNQPDPTVRVALNQPDPLARIAINQPVRQTRIAIDQTFASPTPPPNTTDRFSPATTKLPGVTEPGATPAFTPPRPSFLVTPPGITEPGAKPSLTASGAVEQPSRSANSPSFVAPGATAPGATPPGSVVPRAAAPAPQ